MKKHTLALLSTSLIFCFYSMTVGVTIAIADDVRTWIGCDVGIFSYEKDSQNLFLLGLENEKIFIGIGDKVADSEKIKKIKKEIQKKYTDIIVKNVPHYDVLDKYFKELYKNMLDKNYMISKAIVEAKINEKYGKNWSYIDVYVRIKGTSFPVLYEVKIRQGFNSLIATDRASDIGFATPEGIDAAIINTFDELCQKFVANAEALKQMERAQKPQ